jgi:hypothetical protein
MTRRLFPDNADRLVYRLQGQTLTAAAGAFVTLYLDEAATQLADLRSEGGGAVSDSRLLLDATGRLPLFLGPDDNRDTLYAKPDGSSVVTDVHARVDERLDAVEASITSLSGIVAPTANDIDYRGRRPRGLGTKLHARLANSTAQQLKWLQFGDSVAGLKMQFMYEPLNRAFGGGRPGATFVGGGSGPGWQTIGVSVNSTTGSVTDRTADFDVWPTGLTTQIAAGASRAYGIGGANPYWTRAKVYYVKESGGGSFRVDVAGADATGTLSAAGSGLGIATIDRAAGQYSLAVVGISGNVRIIAVGFEHNAQGGLHLAGVAQGGIRLDTAVASATARANLQAFLADWAPDVISFEMKEDSSYFATALATLFGVFQAGAPLATVIAYGSSPVANTTNDADQVIQNNQLRAACAAFGYLYWDGYAPLVSYATLAALGWQGDGIHPDDRCNAFLAGLVLDDLQLTTHPGAGQGTRLAHHFRARLESGLDLGRLRDDGGQALASIDADLTFQEDLSMKFRRFFDFLNPTDNSIWMRWDPRGLVGSIFPSSFRLGSTGPRLLADANGVTIDNNGGVTRDLTTREVFLDHSVVLKSYTTANRPTTRARGGGLLYGTTIIDQTLGKIIWWNGSSWRDALNGAA